MRACIQSVNPRMLGPNGEALEIVIRDGYKEKGTEIDAHTIMISDIEIILIQLGLMQPILIVLQ